MKKQNENILPYTKKFYRANTGLYGITSTDVTHSLDEDLLKLFYLNNEQIIESEGFEKFVKKTKEDL